MNGERKRKCTDEERELASTVAEHADEREHTAADQRDNERERARTDAGCDAEREHTRTDVGRDTPSRARSRATTSANACARMQHATTCASARILMRNATTRAIAHVWMRDATASASARTQVSPITREHAGPITVLYKSTLRTVSKSAPFDPASRDRACSWTWMNTVRTD